MNANLLAQLTDYLTAAAAALRGDAASGYGSGDPALPLESDWGLSKVSRQFQATLMATNDLGLVTSLMSVKSDFVKRSSGDALVSMNLTQQVMALSPPCRALGLPGVVDIASYLAYLNTGAGGPYQCLLSPGFGDLFRLLYNAPLPASCIFAPPLANMGQKSLGGLFLPGDGVDTGQFAGAAQAQITVSSSAWSAPGQVTVTGQGRAAGGGLVDSRTWAASMGADGTAVLVPAAAGDLLVSVETISLPSSMTAGTVIVSGLAPAGRTA